MERVFEFLTNESEIFSYLDNELDIDISTCKIVDSVVNCSTSIDISSKHIFDLKVQFGKIEGDFFCIGSELHSLVGMPHRVEGTFSCANNALTSLEFAPKYVGADFNCNWNQITSLEHAPEYVGRNFNCHRNKITSFEHCPKIINGDFGFSYNQISSFEHCPEVIYGDAWFDYNKFTSLENSPKEIYGSISIGFNQIQTLKDIPELAAIISLEFLPLLSAYNSQTHPLIHELMDYKDCQEQELEVNFDNLQFHAKIFRENKSNGSFILEYEKSVLLYPTLADKCKALYKAWPWLYIEFCKYEPVLLEHFDYRTKE